MLIFMSIVPTVLSALLIIQNFRLEDKLIKSKIENEDLENLRRELSKENQGYRKVVEKWQKEQDERNKDDWGI